MIEIENTEPTTFWIRDVVSTTELQLIEIVVFIFRVNAVPAQLPAMFKKTKNILDLGA